MQEDHQHTTFSPLTPDIMRREARDRTAQIKQEFEDGFNFLINHPASVTIFGSARFKEDNPHYQKARHLSGRIAREVGYSVLTGGGPGIMEAANRGAFEAGGESLGLNITLPHEQDLNPYVTDSIDFYYFFSRKVCLAFSAEAYIFFPGGFGTLDEFFEIITLVQTRKIEKVPVFLVGSSYWSPLDQFLHEELAGNGTIDEEDTSLYTITDDEDQIIHALNKTTVVPGVRRGSNHNNHEEHADQ